MPTFQGANRLPALLESLQSQTRDHEVIVVANGPGEETQQLVRSRFPEVRLLEPGENLGFGRAVNQAVEACAAETVVLLNDDVVCPSTFLEALLEPLAPEDGVAMASGVLLRADDPTRIDTAGIIFDRTLFASDYLHDESVSLLDQPVPDPLGPSGGAAAFDRRAFEAVGGFDEAFFAYLEDVDLAARLLARGYRCRLASGARAVHHHSATLGSGSARKNELMGWARGYTIGKYRLHRRPRLLARAFLGELVITVGQLAVDRTAVSFPARLRGFRAGRRAARERLPELPRHARDLTLAQMLRLRARRRSY